MQQAELKVISGKQDGNVIPLPKGKFLVGREEDCHLRPNSDMVSRHHCVFQSDGYTVRLRDFGSTNGTLVNGERILSAVTLKEGDKVDIGNLHFEVTIREVDEIVDAPEPGSVVAEEPSGDETLTEMGTFQVGNDETIVMGSDETVVAPGAPEQPAEMPSTDETQEIDQSQLQQMPSATFAQPPMGYPQQYPQQPYGYPPYYQQPQQYPMGYPQGPPMGYPPQGYPQQGYPQQGLPQAPPPEDAPSEVPAAESGSRSNMDVRLPDPSETGAKPPEPKKPAGEGGAEANIPDTAAELIKKYQSRRPGQSSEK